MNHVACMALFYEYTILRRLIPELISSQQDAYSSRLIAALAQSAATVAALDASQQVITLPGKRVVVGLLWRFRGRVSQLNAFDRAAREPQEV